MKKVVIVVLCLAFLVSFTPKSYAAGEGPLETIGAGVGCLLEAAWNGAVWVYGATENTLEKRKLSEPKWVEEEQGRKKTR